MGLEMRRAGHVVGKRDVDGAVPLVRVASFAPFMTFLDEIGAPTDRWLGQARIPTGLLGDPEALVPLFSTYRFLERAAREGHLEDLGMVVGARTSSFELGAYGARLLEAATVRDYLQIGIRLIGSQSRGTWFWLSEERDAVRVHQRIAGPDGLGRCIGDVFTLAVTIGTIRSIIGPAWSPGAVSLLRGDEGLLGERGVLGDAQVITGQGHSSFTVSRDLLQRPVPSYASGASTVNNGRPGAAPPMPDDFVSSIEAVIASLLVDGYTGVHIVAEAAGLSPRTLQRRLTRAGLSYTGLMAAGRTRYAKLQLARSTEPVAHVAAALGYTDASNFARAFRRETGMSPLAYRASRIPH
jgi:hypothetical protein